MNCHPRHTTKVKDILDRAAAILNDREEGYEHIQWPVGDLVTYVNEALCELSAHRPDAFVKQVELTLLPGSRQELPDQYSKLVSLDANIPANGELGGPVTGRKISESSSEFAEVFSSGPSCFSSGPSCGEPPAPHDGENPSAEVLSYQRAKGLPNVFYVAPEVPRGKVVKVAATVQEAPPVHDALHLKRALGVPCKFDSAVLDWVLMRCWEKDIESSFAVAAAERHRGHFYQALGVKYRMESQFNSEYFKGRTPDGDPNKQMQQRREA